jgi:hypothetical protein
MLLEALYSWMAGVLYVQKWDAMLLSEAGWV